MPQDRFRYPSERLTGKRRAAGTGTGGKIGRPKGSKGFARREMTADKGRVAQERLKSEGKQGGSQQDQEPDINLEHLETEDRADGEERDEDKEARGETDVRGDDNVEEQERLKGQKEAEEDHRDEELGGRASSGMEDEWAMEQGRAYGAYVSRGNSLSDPVIVEEELGDQQSVPEFTFTPQEADKDSSPLTFSLSPVQPTLPPFPTIDSASQKSNVVICAEWMEDIGALALEFLWC